MEVRKFEEADYEKMARWYELRGLKAPSYQMLPRTGFVVDNTAATFLYVMETNIGWSEGTVSNPERPKDIRALAIKKLFDAVCTDAKQQNLRCIISSTRIPAVAEYAKEIGCIVKEGSTTIIKDLR